MLGFVGSCANSRHPRARFGGERGANFPQRGDSAYPARRARGAPRGGASPGLICKAQEARVRGRGQGGSEGGRAQVRQQRKGGHRRPRSRSEGALCPQRERGPEARPRPQTRGKFPQTLARGSRPPSAIPSRRPPPSGCSRPRRRGRGALFPAPRRVFPLTPRSPRLLTPPRLRIPPPQPALGLFHLPHPHRFIPIIPPEAVGRMRDGKRFSHPVSVTEPQRGDRRTEPFAE